jgi:hypothetical protein
MRYGIAFAVQQMPPALRVRLHTVEFAAEPISTRISAP